MSGGNKQELVYEEKSLYLKPDDLNRNPGWMMPVEKTFIRSKVLWASKTVALFTLANKSYTLGTFDFKFEPLLLGKSMLCYELGFLKREILPSHDSVDATILLKIAKSKS